MNVRYAPSRLAAVILLMLGSIGSAVAGGLVIIVNPASGVEQLSREQAINIFMGRYRKLPSGIVAFPIDVGSQTQQRKRFYQLLVSKELSEIDAYWARLVFSGQTSPPLQVPDERTAVQLVAGNRSAIAYVERDQVNQHVKVILELELR
jgi:ABC-type phosphate transport system substrate-binding protein